MSAGRVAALCLAAVAVAGCRAEASHRALALSKCRLKKVDHDALCGTLEVFEDRAARTGRKIKLNVAVVPSLAPSAEPDPVFILAGGPGQSAVEVAGFLMPSFELELHHRDIVFVDQRGTGASNPLRCDDPDGGSSEQDELSDVQTQAQLKGCLQRYDADPRLYTTPIAMDDLDDVRAALGYASINLWGASYGTRAGLVYMRQHGDHVRTATLDGVAPMWMTLPLSMARDGQHALDAQFTQCAQDADCARAFPELRARFDALLAQLDKNPAHAKIPDPVTGALEDVTIRRSAFASTLRGLLYRPEAASVLPLTIDRAVRGDYSPYWAEAQELNHGMEKGLATGMFLSVLCAEDVPRVRPEDIGPATAGTFVGRKFTDEMLAACAVWPRGTVPPGYADPVHSDVPTLLLSGDLDPVTPPRYAEEVAKTLPHSLHLVIPGVGHGATDLGCVSGIVSKFITAGHVDGLDVTCARALHRPPFFLSFAGPRP